jgi:tRNA threonylcarbamoyl adenosine modification protein (Sua5/YciO/YrdC/YwlC family)
MGFLRIDLKNADGGAVAAAIAKATSAIRRDALVVLPTETVYGVAADPARSSSVAKVLSLKGRPSEQRFTHHLAETADAAKFAAPLPRPAQRLAARYWPGPLTLVVPSLEGRDVGLRVPAHDFTRKVIAGCGPSLYLTSVNRSGEPPLLTPDAIASGFGDRVDLLCDYGPPPIKLSSTVVRVGADRIDVLREGILTRDEVLATAAATVLFVCTGNTCRSPMAEDTARRLLAARLGVEPQDLAARGIRVMSAGISAGFGEPASDGALDAIREVGGDLGAHVSQPLSPDMVQHAERVYCMTSAHAARVRALAPGGADKITLLRTDGLDIGDPFGGSLARYRTARDEIAQSIQARLAELAGLT